MCSGSVFQDSGQKGDYVFSRNPFLRIPTSLFGFSCGCAYASTYDAFYAFQPCDIGLNTRQFEVQAEQ